MAASAPTLADPMLQPTFSETHRIWQNHKEWWFCLLSFGRRRGKCSLGLQKMFILLFSVLLN